MYSSSLHDNLSLNSSENISENNNHVKIGSFEWIIKFEDFENIFTKTLH